jgi:predicted nucleic acid-binding protein
MLNLDTHILLHALAGTVRPREERLLRDRWSISAIVLWEIAKLAELGRIRIDLHREGLCRVLERIEVFPVSIEVCRALSRLDFRSDSADGLIAATSLVHGVPLLTRDRRILRSRIVPLAKR